MPIDLQLYEADILFCEIKLNESDRREKIKNIN